MAALDLFSPATRAWFERSFRAPTAAQEQGWEAIASGAHTLIHAPTGSGKTLAAFLWALDRLFAEETPDEGDRCRVLYVSPLKALAYDIDRNLRAPLRGIANEIAAGGGTAPEVATAMRTGDTTQTERRRMRRHPPDLLITTPESLYLMLTSGVREILTSVRWVVVDEIHSIAGSKRGTHLAVSLERLTHLTDQEPQRIGLSATQRPLERIAQFLGGGVAGDNGWQPRPVSIVDAPRDKRIELDIVVPVEDMTRPEGVDDEGNPTRTIWTSVYPEILELVQAHKSTIVFANNRGLVERLAQSLNELAGEDLARAHHGSVSREQRVEIEDALKTGRLKCVVATSSLELGIDMDAVDLVVLVESPTTVARGLQRVGRAGHQVGAVSRARVFPKHRGDLLEATVVAERMLEGAIEETQIPQNPLDVLAQQVVAATAMSDWKVDDLFAMVRGAAPYRDLARGPFEAVLDMLAGRYPSDDFAELRPRLNWDRVAGTLSARPGASILAVTNAGTIPDRGLYPVVLPEGGRVGELDEEMVYESRVGDVFVLGSSTWRMLEITPDRVVAAPAPGMHGARLPFWHGDSMGRPLETGRAIGEFVRDLARRDDGDAIETLRTGYHLDQRAAANLIEYLREEKAMTGSLPDDRTIVIERFRDEIGDWRLVLLSPFGARVHAPWALALRRKLRDEHGTEADAVWSDDGIIVRFPDADAAPDPAGVVIDPEEVEALVLDEVSSSALFAGRFREAAARSLLLPRRRPGRRTPLWLQRRRSTSLLEAALRYPTFPVVLEAYREVLQEHFDLASLIELLTEVRARKIRVHIADTSGPSPFATSLSFDFVASFMYEYDAPPAERRALALTVDRALLEELLGEPSLRDLLDPGSIADLELELQALTEERKASSPDSLTDLLRRLGPLTTVEIAERSSITDPEAALADLVDNRRVIRVSLAGGQKWAATEDATRLRDALGATLPIGLPEALLEPVADPLGDLVSRYARTHGPFTTDAVASHLGLPTAPVATALHSLEQRGRIVQGAFQPGGSGSEWVDAEVLRRIRRRSLAALRREIEAVDPEALGGFLVGWHRIGSDAGGAARMAEVVSQIQGVAVPASILEADILPSRLQYSPDLLDSLTASGEVVWLGRGPLGSRDGKLAIYRRDQVSALHWAAEDEGDWTDLHRGILTHLSERGASFFGDLYAAAGGGDPEDVLSALWDLVWAGRVTNDTIAPLRAFLWGRIKTSRKPRLPSTAPPAGSGRWYLVSDLVGDFDPTQAATAQTEQLLERHGVLVRDAVLAEGVPGGFAGLYPVLRAMEDVGRVRRGYFIEGRGGAQFALPGAVDRLRAGTFNSGPVVLASADPANPYGAALPWPEGRGHPSRSAGSHVVMIDGKLLAHIERGGATVTTFTDDPGMIEACAEALTGLGRRFRRPRAVARIDGGPAKDSPLGRAMEDRGYVQSYRGLSLPR